MAKKILGIDLGTSTIKIYKKREGIILDERNIIAIANKKDVIAVGNEAFEMFEKAPANINVSYPVSYGVIAEISQIGAVSFEPSAKTKTGKRVPVFRIHP